MTVTRHTKAGLEWFTQICSAVYGKARAAFSPETLNSTYNWKMAWICSLFFSAQAYSCKVMSVLRHWACHY